MYVREIQEPADSPVKDGNPVIGTWTAPFRKVDLLEIDKLYSLSFLPKKFINFRIKESQCYSVQNDNFILKALFSDFKLFRIIRVFLYDIKTSEKYFFRDYDINPNSGWKFPLSLANSIIKNKVSNKNKINFNIHNWLDAGIVRLDLNIPSGGKRPSLTMHLAFNVNNRETTPMTVSLEIAKRGILYAYKVFALVRGDVILGNRCINLKEVSYSGFFCDYKGVFPAFMRIAVCSASGVTSDKKRFAFHIAENKTKESNKNNENALWLNGELTPLPPVLITMPYGLDGIWVIQDFYGMIDLTYTPLTGVSEILGHYNGMLMTKNGEQIHIKNLLGIGEKSILRV